MYAVSQEFLNQMKAPVRKVLARVTIDYTDPTQDQTIEVAASEQANASCPAQTADFATEPAYKWATLDGAWVLDGTWHLAPLPEDAYLYQMGWWSAQVAGEDGRFSEPYPTLILTHPARPVLSYQVVGDVARQEWPTEFVIRLYGPDGSLLRERTVTGNAEIQFYELLDPPALDVTRQELEIRAWSHPGRHAKILEFFTSLQETYEGNDLLEVHLLEESESGNGVGRGGVSTNEITVRLINRGGRFDVINPQSPFRELLRPNRRVQAWLGVEGAKHLWGEGRYAPFDRDLTLSRQDGTAIEPLPDYVVTRRPGEGRFGGAVAVEEATTNLLKDVADFTTSPWGRSNVDVTSLEYNGMPGARFTPTGADSAKVYQTFLSSGAAGRTFTWSFYARGQTARAFHVNFYGGVSGTFQSYAIQLTTEWRRYSITHTFPATATSGRIEWGNVTPYWGTAYLDWIEVAGVQVEEKPYPTSFVDGTRAAGKLDYKLPLTNPHTGHLWMYAPYRIESVYYGGAAKDNSPLFELIDEATGYHLEFETYRNRPFIDPAIGTYTSHRHSSWIPEAHTWYGVTWKLLPDNFIVEVRDVSGNLIQTWDAPSSEFAGFHPTKLRLGVFGGAVIIDELLILPYAASEEHIAELYRETRPLYDEWVPLGVFWSTNWDSEELEAMVRARDRMELLRRTTYEPGPLKQNVSLYELAQDVLTHAQMPPETYRLDPGLQDIVVPWGWVPPGSHRDALRVIAEAGMARVYCDRDGILRIERVTAPTGDPVLEITQDDYFPPARNPVTSALVANRVVVTTQPLVPASSPEEVYRATLEVPAGQTIAVRAEYNKRPVINVAASLESPPAGVSIVEVTYGAVAAEVQIRNTGASMASVTLAITGRPLSVQGGVQVVEEDASSVRELGLIVHEVPTNPLVQTREHAQAIAQAILARSAKQRRDVELEWRGNPALEVDDVVSVDGMRAQVVRQELSWAGALSARLVARRLD